MRWLIDYGTEINLVNSWGATPLAYAARMPGDEHTVGLLLRFGADIRLGDPVHAAAEYGHAEALRLLLNHGVSADQPNAGKGF